MKNNLKALGIHLVIVILSTIFLVVFVITGPIIGQYMTHIISRLFMGIGFIGVYIYSGMLLSTDIDSKYDFLVGCFIAVVGIALWYYTFSITGKDLLEIPKGEEDYWILMNLYQTPVTFVGFLFRLPNAPLLTLITNLIPSFLMGLGLKYKRLKAR